MNTARFKSMAAALFFCSFGLQGADSKAPSVDGILASYVKALGGSAAIDRIKTRQLTASSHLERSVKMYWEAPNQVLREGNREREGFDGAAGWYETKRKRVQKLPHSREEEMQTDSNPIRYAHLKDMFGELDVDPHSPADSDVITAANRLGATKFFFDRETHLLSRIEEFGVSSSYFKRTTEFLDYEEIDGILLPRRIKRASEEPGSEKGDVRLLKVKQNIQLDAEMFRKPDIGKIVSGGKH